MNTLSQSETLEERQKRLWWEKAPTDPTQQAKKAGFGHYNRSLGVVLMPQSVMPIGPHTGLLMERVPQEYLAWVQSQPWAATWHQWEPVADYLTRFPLREWAYSWPDALVYVTPMQPCTPTKAWTSPSECLLRPHPDMLLHEDKFHTVALMLGLSPRWYDHERKCYHLTEAQRTRAIAAGAFPLLSDARHRAAEFRRLRESGESTCTKHCYSSQTEATTAANLILTSRRRNRPDYLRGYECEKCGFWHLTRSRA